MMSSDSPAKVPVAYPSAEVATHIVNEFADRLLRLARSRLTGAVRSKMDPEDVLQSVFRSFFRRWRDGSLEVDNLENLWGLLALITRRKCGRRIQHFASASRDVGREAKLQDEPGAIRWSSCASAPDPWEAAALAETLDRLMGMLDAYDRQLVGLHLQCYTYAEIADKMGCSSRTVRRAIDRARDLLRGFSDTDSGHTEAHLQLTVASPC